MSRRLAGTQSCGTILDIPIYPHHQRPDGLLAMLLNRNTLLVLICLYITLAHVARSTLPNNILTCSSTRHCQPPPSSASWQPPRPPNQFTVVRPSQLAFLSMGSSSATVRPGWAHSNVQRGRCVQTDDDDDGNHGGGGGGIGVATLAATTRTLPRAPRPLCATRRRRRQLQQSAACATRKSCTFTSVSQHRPPLPQLHLRSAEPPHLHLRPA
jgi:hypothetical protein